MNSELPTLLCICHPKSMDLERSSMNRSMKLKAGERGWVRMCSFDGSSPSNRQDHLCWCHADPQTKHIAAFVVVPNLLSGHLHWDGKLCPWTGQARRFILIVHRNWANCVKGKINDKCDNHLAETKQVTVWSVLEWVISWTPCIDFRDGKKYMGEKYNNQQSDLLSTSTEMGSATALGESFIGLIDLCPKLIGA